MYASKFEKSAKSLHPNVEKWRDEDKLMIRERKEKRNIKGEQRKKKNSLQRKGNNNKKEKIKSENCD